MARTKQTVRRSTGGNAPRKQLATLSESAILDLARLRHAQKIFVKSHRKFLLYGIHKQGAIIIMYVIAISYAITKTKIQRTHVGLCEQSQFSDQFNFGHRQLHIHSHHTFSIPEQAHRKSQYKHFMVHLYCK